MPRKTTVSRPPKLEGISEELLMILSADRPNSVPVRLQELAKLYVERNAIYKDNYKRIGAAFVALFPNGVDIRTDADFNRFSIFVHIFGKITRYAAQFSAGGHPDSLDDISVYSQMLQEIDKEYKS